MEANDWQREHLGEEGLLVDQHREGEGEGADRLLLEVGVVVHHLLEAEVAGVACHHLQEVEELLRPEVEVVMYRRLLYLSHWLYFP